MDLDINETENEQRCSLFLLNGYYSKQNLGRTFETNNYTFNPLPGDIIDVNQPRQLKPYVPVVSIANDIVVNMDGGVGGSWREISLPENYQEPFIPDFHD